MIFDTEKNTILEGFGVSFERRAELVELYIHGSRGDILDRICNDETMPPNERYMLLVEAGARFVDDEYYRIHETITQRHAASNLREEG